MDDDAIANCYCDTSAGRRVRSNDRSDLAIKIALMLKGIFNLLLRVLQDCIDSPFGLMNVGLRSPNYTSTSMRAQTVDRSELSSTSERALAHLVIDSIVVKVFSEG
ncbi:transposase [Vibrio fluvialis]|nr:transposase [Vibrio fluvialis]